MSRILQHLPELEGDEQIYVARLFKDFTDEQAEQFAHVYRQRRKDTTLTLLTAMLGLVSVGGVHRFYLDQIGMGLLYLFTAGLCFVGTIFDLFQHKSLTFDYNRKKADEVAVLVTTALPNDTDRPDSLPPPE